MSTEGEALQLSVLPYRCSKCLPLVTQQMLNDGKFQDTERFLFPCPRRVLSRLPAGGASFKYATVPSTHKKTWIDFLPIGLHLTAVPVLVVVQPSSEFSDGQRVHAGVCLYCWCLCSNVTSNLNTHEDVLSGELPCT
jgi:hypothetical protein